MSAPELACKLSSALESGASGDLVASLLQQLKRSQDPSIAEISDLDEVWMDIYPLVIQAAAQSGAAEAAAAALVAAAAQHCTAREVFTLCLATLAEQLSEDPPACAESHGPANPAFQLSLLEALHSCLPRIRRRVLHFLGDALQMQLRWAGEVLPLLPLGSSARSPGTASASSAGEGMVLQQLTVVGAVASLARLAGGTADWVNTSTEQQLSAEDRQAALQLQGVALLQLVSLELQLPRTLEAGAAAVGAGQQGMQQQQSGGTPLAAAFAAGSRMPLMHAAATALLALPCRLLAAVPITAVGAGGSGTCSSDSSNTASPESLQQLAQSLDSLLSGSGLAPADLAYFSAAEAGEGAALAACAASLDTSTSPAQHAARLECLLPQAACLLLNLGAQHQSVALTLLPLCALCTAGSQLAGQATADTNTAPAAVRAVVPNSFQLAASSAALDALFAALVAIMSHNPVQLLRSCAHDALHALLGAFQPAARLAQLRHMMTIPSTAAAVVALQRLRQEMAAAWGAPSGSSGVNASPGSGSSSSSGNSSGRGRGSSSQLWLSSAVLESLAFPCLVRDAEGGWHDEGSVLAAADVQAAALSLLRWVLLRERAAPAGMLPPRRAASLLRADLLPLQACVDRLLQVQGRAAAGEIPACDSTGSSTGSTGGQQQQQRVDGFLAAQRLHEALGCVLELLQPLAAAAAAAAVS